MFGAQKAALAQALLAHEQAVHDMQAARGNVRVQREAFLARPKNLFYPFTAGILVAASQFKNVPKGLNRLPLMNIAHSAIGAYGLVTRVMSLQRQNQAEEQA